MMQSAHEKLIFIQNPFLNIIWRTVAQRPFIINDIDITVDVLYS